MDRDTAQAVEFLAANGYQVKGITFDFFMNEGLSGVGLLEDGREVRFWIPNHPGELPVVGIPRPVRV